MRDALTAATPAARPTLHLSGAKLRTALAALIKAAETVGGIERLGEAVRLKAELFQERLGEGRAARIERAPFEEIVRFMPTVRRRIGAPIERQGWPAVRAAIAELLRDAHVPGTADSRIAAFESALRASEGISSPRTPQTRGLPLDPPIMGAGGRPPGRHRSERFIRDLAVELLHNVWPEHYPLMTRWVWDAKTNTGVLREIWHDAATGSDDVDHLVIDVPDGHETHLALREELSQFLSGEGIFRDMIWYVDLISAQVYGDYINAQGGAYLKTDFNAGASDPLEHTRRILGLDARGASRRRMANSE